MDNKRKSAFVKRVKMAKGGAVRRNYALGGPTQLTSDSSTQSSGMTSPGGTLGNVGNALGISSDSGLGQVLGGANSLNPLNTQDQFRAKGAPLQAGTNAAQLDTAYGQAQSGLQQQQDFYNALANQNGIGNQSQVYNQLQNVAAGRGPNPAQAMLNQATGQNVANQAALMAGQRGAASNVGLLARQSAQQGAATQQQAVGQGATMEANQRLNAINAAGNIAGQQVNQQGQALTGYNTAAQNEQNTLQGANSNFNNAQVGMQSNINNVNGQISQGNQAANNGMLSGIMNGGAAQSMLGGILAKGGLVGVDGKRVSAITIRPNSYTHHYDDGGSVDFGHESYTAPETGSAPSIGSMAATDEAAPFKQSGGGGGGGGGGLLALAALSDGGEVQPTPILGSGRKRFLDGGSVNFGNESYTSPVSVGAPNIGSMAGTDEAGAFKQNPKKKKPAQGQPGQQQGGGDAVGDGGQQSQLDSQTMIRSSGPGGADDGTVSTPNVQSNYPLTGGSDTPIYAARGGMAGPYRSHVANFLAAGGQPDKGVAAMVSPGEVYLDKEAVRKVVEDGANPMKVGEKFKGKAKVKNDSLKNDTLPRALEEGGIVIPRHITTHKMAAEKAELFVHRTLARKRMH